jgi:ABC-type lipoprotein export system ATPase subunit
MTSMAPRHEVSPPVVDLRGISRTFGTAPPVMALRDVDLTIEYGDSLAIVGPSGSGKSTLLNILSCLDHPTDGTYRFAGIDVGELDDDQRALLRAERIGFVFQSFNLLAHRTVLENVMLAEVYQGGNREGRAERAMEQLELVGMTHRADFRPTRISGGEQQRVAIAAAAARNAPLVLADEPTAELDEVNERRVLEALDGLRKDHGTTVVVVTHSLSVAAAADRVVVIRDGRVHE